jgi:DNA-directed RNA polymerase subunit RPC12/RpoP
MIDPTKNVKATPAVDPLKLPRIGVNEERFELEQKDYSLTREQMETMMATIYVCTKCKQEASGGQCRMRVKGAAPGTPFEFHFQAEKMFLVFERVITLPDGTRKPVSFQGEWELRCKGCGGKVVPTDKPKVKSIVDFRRHPAPGTGRL